MAAYRIELQGVPLTVHATVDIGTPPSYWDDGDVPECEISQVMAGDTDITDQLSVAQLDRIEFELIDRAIAAQRVAARNKRFQQLEAAL